MALIFPKQYEKNKPTGVEEAQKYLTKAWNKNFAPTCFNLGLMYDQSMGVQENKKIAENLYQK